MNTKEVEKLKHIQDIVAKESLVLQDPQSSEAAKQAAIARVDALGNSYASANIRRCTDYLGDTPEGQAAMKRMQVELSQDREAAAQFERLRAFARGERGGT